MNTKTCIVSELAIEKTITFDVCFIVAVNFQLDCFLNMHLVLPLMKLDTYHILKLLSSEHVTTFKRKLSKLVTKLKLQVNVFLSSVPVG